MRTLIEEIQSLSDICIINAFISQVRQIKSELRNAGSQWE